MPEAKDCLTCRNWLGGIYNCCRLNLEAECREGGGYEAWTPRPARLKELGAGE